MTAAYGVDYNKPILYVWGRNAEEKKLFVLRSMRPHFYIPIAEKSIAEQFPFVTGFGKVTKDIFSEEVLEVFTQLPKNVGDLRQREVFSKTWEADVLFPLAMMIEKGVYGSFDITDGVMTPCEPLYVPLKIATLDFEVNAPREIFPDPELADWPMISAAVHNSYSYGYPWRVFVWTASAQPSVATQYCDIVDDMVTYDVFSNERDFLAALINYFEEERFDVITGWNSNSFDLLYLYNRCEKLGINIQKLSPIGAVYKRSSFGSKTYMQRARSEVLASGVVLFDGLTSYKKVMVARGELESYSLAYVAEYELGEERVKEQQEDLWTTNDPIRIGNYPLRDCFYTLSITQKRRVIDYFDKIRKKTGCRLEDAITNSKLLDSFCLHKAHDKGFVLPSKPKVKIQIDDEPGYKGAIVRDPRPGRHRDIGVLDFTSHYPNAMISCNMSPETYVVGEPTPGRPFVEVGNGERFYTDKKGFVPELLEELAIERAKYTNEMDKIAIEKGTTNDEWDVLYWLQFAVKFINTAFYGVFAYKAFRLYLPAISASTTFIGRLALSSGIEFIIITLPGQRSDNFKYDVTYGDTDSLFVTLPKATLEELDWVAENVNEHLATVAASMKLTKELKLKSERIFKSLIMKDAKKRYFGEMLWKDGAFIPSDDPERYQTKGFEAKRSDSSRFTRRVQKTILQMLCDFKSEKDIYNRVEAFIGELKAGSSESPESFWVDVGIPKGISSGKIVTLNSPQTRGARYAAVYYDRLVMQFFKPKRLYVKFPGLQIGDGLFTKWYEETDEIAFEDVSLVPKFFFNYIDYDKMVDKCIYSQLEEILGAVKMNIRNVGHGQTALTRYF
jgi:DNA polymerase I